MIAVIFVLFLYANGTALEYTPYDGLSDCLSMKRKIERNVGYSSNFDERWVCKKAKVKLKEDSDGKKYIESLVND